MLENIRKEMNALEYGFIIRESEYIGNECVTISNGKTLVVTLTEVDRGTGMEPYHMAHVEIINKQGEWEHIGNYPLWFKNAIPSFIESLNKRYGVIVETMDMAMELARQTVSGDFTVKTVSDWDWLVLYQLECESCILHVSVHMDNFRTTIDKLDVKGRA